MRNPLRYIAELAGAPTRIAELQSTVEQLSRNNMKLRTAYDAARLTNLTAKMNELAVQKSALAVLMSDGPRLRRVSRNLCRNNPVAIRAQEFYIDRTVGDCGFRPQVSEAKVGKRLANEIERAWGEWTESVSHRDQQSLAEFARMVAGEEFECGEAFVEHSITPDRQLVLDCFESEQLTDAGRPLGGQTVGGVEYDKIGRVVAYHVQPVRPEWFGLSLEAERIPAERVMHIYERKRPSQYRGAPRFAGSIVKLGLIDDADTGEAAAILLGANIGLHIKGNRSASQVLNDLGGEDSTIGSGTGDNTVDTKDINFYPGGITILPEEIAPIDPKRPGNQYGPFTANVLKKSLVACGVPYSAGTGDTSGSNYSTERATAMYFTNTWRSWQLRQIKKFWAPLFANAFLPWAEATGRIKLNFNQSLAFIAMNTVWPLRAYEWVDPKAEMEAWNGKMELRACSWEQMVYAMGGDPEQVKQGLIEDKKWMDENGVTLPSVVSIGGGAAAKDQGDEKDAGESDDNDEVMANANGTGQNGTGKSAGAGAFRRR